MHMTWAVRIILVQPPVQDSAKISILLPAERLETWVSLTEVQSYVGRSCKRPGVKVGRSIEFVATNTLFWAVVPLSGKGESSQLCNNCLGAHISVKDHHYYDDCRLPGFRPCGGKLRK